MQSRFLLNIIVSQRPAIFKLLARKYQALLIRWNAFLVLLADNNTTLQRELQPNSVQRRCTARHSMHYAEVPS